MTACPQKRLSRQSKKMTEYHSFLLVGSHLCANQHAHLPEKEFWAPTDVELCLRPSVAKDACSVEVRAKDGSLLGHMPQALAQIVATRMQAGIKMNATAQVCGENAQNPILPLRVTFAMDLDREWAIPDARLASEATVANFRGHEQRPRNGQSAGFASGSAPWSARFAPVSPSGEKVGRACLYGCATALLFWAIFAFGTHRLFGDSTTAPNGAAEAVAPATRISVFHSDPPATAFSALASGFSTTDLPNELLRSFPAKPAQAKATMSAATAGDAEAQLRVALMLRAGNGLPQNSREAVRWLTLSAESGNLTAAYAMGVWTLQGSTVPADAQRAALWLEVAARGGVPDAQYALALLALSGHGQPKNTGLGRKRMEIAANNGSPQALEWLVAHPFLGQ